MTTALRCAVQRALSAWDTTTLKTNGDGMLSEAIESLRAEFDTQNATTPPGGSQAAEPGGSQARVVAPFQAPEGAQPWTVSIAGPDDVHRFETELDALRFANQVNRTYLADLLAHPGDEVLCLATVTDASLPLVAPAEAEPISKQYLREQVSKQMQNVREALSPADSVLQLPSPKTYPRLADLAGDIRAAIDKHDGELPLASALGVLEIVKARLIEENTP